MLHEVFKSPFILAASAAHLCAKSDKRFPTLWGSLWDNMGVNYPTPEIADVAFGNLTFVNSSGDLPISPKEFYQRFNVEIPSTFVPHVELTPTAIAPYTDKVSFCAIRFFLETLDKFHILDPKERTMEIQGQIAESLKPIFRNFFWPEQAIQVLCSASALKIASVESRHIQSPAWRVNMENLALRFTEFQTLYTSMQ